MTKLSSFILCIGTAAVMIGILTDLTNPKTGPGIILRISAGLFLMIQIWTLFQNFQVDSWYEYISAVETQSDAAIRQGTTFASDQMSQIIKEKAGTYILDIAREYGTDLAVEVEVDESDIPVPTGVRLTGNISPYAKKQLQQMIETELNIPKERQQWIGN